MKIIFNNIELENFFSFGHVKYEFDDSVFVKISGINNSTTDNASSNGAGKSALFDGLVWALTGETTRGTKDVVNIFSSDGAYVKLDFNIDDLNYVVLRSKDHSKYKTNLKLFVN